MKILYDMSSGRILESPRQERKPIQSDFHQAHLLPEMQLQETNSDQGKAQQMPPVLDIVDLNSFLNKMS